MRKTFIVATLAGCLAAPMVAHADDAAAPPPPPYTLTGNFTLASEYLYRGIAQSNHKPAIQGGIDFAHSSGVYVGTWASSISWLADQSANWPGTPGVSAPMEWDFYGGFKNTIYDDFSYDVGVLTYYYPGEYPDGFVSPNTTELYVAGGWKTITLKYSYAVTNLFGATSPTDATQKASDSGSYYVDLSGSYDLGEGFGVVGHVGYQKVKGAKGADGTTADYTDYKVGVTKDLLGFSLALSYIGTNAKGDAGQFYHSAYDKDLGKGRVLFTVGKTL